MLVEMSLCSKFCYDPKCLNMIQTRLAKLKFLKVKEWIWSLILVFDVVCCILRIWISLNKVYGLIGMIGWSIPRGSGIFRSGFKPSLLVYNSWTAVSCSALRSGARCHDRRERRWPSSLFFVIVGARSWLKIFGFSRHRVCGLGCHDPIDCKVLWNRVPGRDFAFWRISNGSGSMLSWSNETSHNQVEVLSAVLHDCESSFTITM